MDTHKINIEKFQQFILKLFDLCKVHIVYLMEELVRMKNEINEQKVYVNSQCLAILDEWRRNSDDTAIKFREQTQRLTVDHELELSDMKAALNEKDNVISSLKIETEHIRLEHQKEIDRFNEEHQSTKHLLEKTREEIGSFEKKLEEVEVNKQKEIKSLQEKMHQDYKTEIESLRSRLVQIRLIDLISIDFIRACRLINLISIVFERECWLIVLISIDFETSCRLIDLISIYLLCKSM